MLSFVDSLTDDTPEREPGKERKSCHGNEARENHRNHNPLPDVTRSTSHYTMHTQVGSHEESGTRMRSSMRTTRRQRRATTMRISPLPNAGLLASVGGMQASRGCSRAISEPSAGLESRELRGGTTCKNCWDECQRGKPMSQGAYRRAGCDISLRSAGSQQAWCTI